MKKRQWSGTGKQQLNNATQCGAGLGLLVTTVVLDTATLRWSRVPGPGRSIHHHKYQP